MRQKTRTTLYMDPKIVEKAKKTGINISQFCENALIEAIKRLEDVYRLKNPKFFLGASGGI